MDLPKSQRVSVTHRGDLDLCGIKGTSRVNQGDQKEQRSGGVEMGTGSSNTPIIHDATIGLEVGYFYREDQVVQALCDQISVLRLAIAMRRDKRFQCKQYH